ncbi:MAG: hypothetical protein JXA90_12455, partial [Planctomycetes bacterium]|nr:hypothetical protein [Planctomycetota bacterium]
MRILPSAAAAAVFAAICIVSGPASLAAQESADLACADVNGDDAVNLSDAVYILSWLFAAGPSPSCEGLVACGDVNSDGR